MERQKLVYQVDQRDVIVFADPEWDRFALANAGHGVSSAKVLGRSLWDFLVDSTTRQLYRLLLQRTRNGCLLRFNFRCDSPDLRRLMEMEMSAAEGGAVQFRTRAVSETERESQSLWERREARSDDLLVACGWCKKVQVEGEWEEVEEAVMHLRLFERALLPSITHGICEDCHRKVLRTLTVSNEIQTLNR